MRGKLTKLLAEVTKIEGNYIHLCLEGSHISQPWGVDGSSLGKAVDFLELQAGSLVWAYVGYAATGQATGLVSLATDDAEVLVDSMTEAEIVAHGGPVPSDACGSCGSVCQAWEAHRPGQEALALDEHELINLAATSDDPRDRQIS